MGSFVFCKESQDVSSKKIVVKQVVTRLLTRRAGSLLKRASRLENAQMKRLSLHEKLATSVAAVITARRNIPARMTATAQTRVTAQKSVTAQRRVTTQKTDATSTD